MRATGIVRRIDDLGRIVIPKEIRRTLCIRESDPLEIYTDREGGIILKKYSPIGEIGPLAKKYTESLFQTTGMVAAITDRDQVVAVSGGLKNMQGKNISPMLEQKLDARETVSASQGDRGFVEVIGDSQTAYYAEVICPIICEGDVIGAVMLLAVSDKAGMTDTEKKLVMTAANFLGKQMEQ